MLLLLNAVVFERLGHKLEPCCARSCIDTGQKGSYCFEALSVFPQHLSNQVGGSVCLLALALAPALLVLFFSFLNDNENLY